MPVRSPRRLSPRDAPRWSQPGPRFVNRYPSLVLSLQPNFYARLGEKATGSARDEMGGTQGSYLGGVTVNQTGLIQGDPDTGVLLDGTNGRLSVPSNTALNVGDTFTLAIWIKRSRTGTASNEYLFNKGAGGLALFINTANSVVFGKQGTANIVTSTATIADTANAHFVVATKNGTTSKLYIDGVDVTGSVVNQTIVDTTNALIVGTDGVTTQPFGGTIDEVAVFGRALSQPEIVNLWVAGNAFNPHDAPNAVTISGGGDATLLTKAGRSSATTISGGGAITVSGLRSKPAPVTGGGSLAASDRKNALSAHEVYPANNLYPADDLYPGPLPGVAESGGGSVTPAGKKVALGATTITGGGSATATGVAGRKSAATVTGGGLVAASGTEGHAVPAPISGGGNLAATGLKGASRAITLTGGGLVTPAGRKGAVWAVTVTGGGLVTATGTAVFARSGTAAITGGGTLTANGQESHAVLTGITGGGTLTVAYTRSAPTISLPATCTTTVFAVVRTRTLVGAT